MGRRRSSYTLPKLKLKQKTITAVGSLISFILAVITITSIVTNTQMLTFWKEFLFGLLGWTYVASPVIFVLAGLILTKLKWKIAQVNVLLGAILIFLALGGMLSAFSADFGGSIGSTLWQQLTLFVTGVGAIITLVLIFIVGIVVLFNASLSQVLGVFGVVFRGVTGLFGSVLAKKNSFEIKHAPLKIKVSGDEERPAVRSEPLKIKKDTVIADTLVQNIAGSSKVWKYPNLGLLSDKVGTPADRGDINKSAEIIEKTLDSFGIAADVAEVNGGPAVTQYALRISAGTKISKIANLQHDIALALATPTGTVRVEAPIPGKSLVGIEVPNRSLEIVGIKSILGSSEMSKHKSKLAVALGRDTASKPVIIDIDRMPHALIAGTTGSGKSVMLNAIIASLLYRNSPDEL